MRQQQERRTCEHAPARAFCEGCRRWLCTACFVVHTGRIASGEPCLVVEAMLHAPYAGCVAHDAGRVLGVDLRERAPVYLES
jgi:hypothetical protein